jgi:hypothetical protein
MKHATDETRERMRAAQQKRRQREAKLKRELDRRLNDLTRRVGSLEADRRG